jgi:hypothetical protein
MNANCYIATFNFGERVQNMGKGNIYFDLRDHVQPNEILTFVNNFLKKMGAHNIVLDSSTSACEQINFT